MSASYVSKFETEVRSLHSENDQRIEATITSGGAGSELCCNECAKRDRRAIADSNEGGPHRSEQERSCRADDAYHEE